MKLYIADYHLEAGNSVQPRKTPDAANILPLLRNDEEMDI